MSSDADMEEEEDDDLNDTTKSPLEPDERGRRSGGRQGVSFS